MLTGGGLVEAEPHARTPAAGRRSRRARSPLPRRGPRSRRRPRARSRRVRGILAAHPRNARGPDNRLRARPPRLRRLREAPRVVSPALLRGRAPRVHGGARDPRGLARRPLTRCGRRRHVRADPSGACRAARARGRRRAWLRLSPVVDLPARRPAADRRDALALRLRGGLQEGAPPPLPPGGARGGGPFRRPLLLRPPPPPRPPGG